MTAPGLDQTQLGRIAESLRLSDRATESDDAIAFHDEARLLVRAGSCAKLAGVLTFVNHRSALGAIHDNPIDPQRAGQWLGDFIERHSLNPAKTSTDGVRVELRPWSRYTEAVVFDGKERKRVRARTDAGVRFALNGIALSGPRTRIRAIFGSDERPLMLHVAVWDRLEHYADAELVREHDVLVALEKSLRGRKDCDVVVRANGLRLAYAASEEFHGRPDLLAPYYFVEVESPIRGSKSRSDGGQSPRQLLKIPAWRFTPQNEVSAASVA